MSEWKRLQGGSVRIMEIERHSRVSAHIMNPQMKVIRWLERKSADIGNRYPPVAATHGRNADTTPALGRMQHVRGWGDGWFLRGSENGE